ncbi:hypothetical protein COS31_01540 [Candidatus Roizmanbacteria bacterium CG02_land_8_20_14_3_00_36_15]|uniref:Uncharacterized protein n=2 Tax=Candidatus Roizmaniibacteriota TaxID=1752723 RepID=A0A2M8KKV1_9BACT|nr:MAG: hypothetical protein COS51_05455 [Candidatus Roizmanbacteria bacterium CG03_land_8_20_14_0_80_36_21]PIV37986.1 MAG: hypothetical protein COS31_01540 [Candidatus Roizmanbacteria bacterium CG02_land_8_20_14_3_00_36_15]PIY70138.1 MAG: hypothetical protein COY89_02835 [Candidatus Roizmanbacteria bacterium CG_4_10_14_0_8_um_filter_36_36]PJA52830.1 MAG: hypothetical protein CO166_04140 [Candidatus Roizmanbacteria bacterium CG_4_9_14_3_um_filter_36_11]PJE60551.1 MAG: hypothetical protein COU86
MTKPGFWDDTFEQIVELGQSTVKQGAKAVSQTFSPIKLFERAAGKSQNPHDKGKEQLDEAKKKSNSSTPLDFEKLQEKYQDQDKSKMESLRNRLFHIVKQGEEKVLEQKKADEKQKVQKEEYEKEQKKQQNIQQEQAQQAFDEPRGKVRQSIFSRKKVAKRQQTEVRPSAGKQ